ncbi:MAG TPA: GNAT family N-acetyltransferase [Thermomicrobiales bacterium]|nr:GNAT family N-acetyltransferase [Thermomicrobiales bacterium]
MPRALVRNATPDDATAIAAIHVASWQATYRGHMDDAYLDSLSVDERVGMWSQILEFPRTAANVLVAEIQGKVIGFYSFGRSRDSDLPGDTAVLHTIYVHPDLIRSGIGIALLARAERAMREAGIDLVSLWVLRENIGARRFYERCGRSFNGEERREELWGQPPTEVRYTRSLSSGDQRDIGGT